MLGQAAPSEHGDRNVQVANTPAGVADLVHLVRSEYLEIPGLHLTHPQVQRLWSLDAATCDAVVDVLLGVRFLRRTRAGAYVRDESGR